MNQALKWSAGALVLLMLIVYGCLYWPRGPTEPSPAELAELALRAADAQQQESAAVKLASLQNPAAREYLRRVYRESPSPPVRAACVQGLGWQHDYDSMNLLLDALDDESTLVRARAGHAIVLMIGRDYGFNPDADPAERARIVRDIRESWKQLDGSPLLETFKETLE